MKKHLLKRFVLRLLVLLSGLFFIAMGVALSTKSGLGVSPSASLPYLLCRLFPISMGTFTIIVNIVFVLVQILLLRKNYHPIQLLQLAVVMCFGFFTDFTNGLVAAMQVTAYPLRLALCVVSCAVMGFGLYLEVKAGLIVMATEGAISAFAQVFHLEFGKVKIGLDCGFVIVSCCVSLIGFGRLEGIREGTVLAAVLVGLFVQLYSRKFHFLDKLLETEQTADRKAARSGTPLVITIERELGSGGHEIGQRIAKELGIPFYDYALIAETAEKTGFSEEVIRQQEERLSSPLLYGLYQASFASSQSISRQDAIFYAQSKVIEDYAAAGSCVIVGRLASYILRNRANCFHVFVTADETFRAERIRDEKKESQREALLRLRREDSFRQNYCRHFTGEPWGLACHYAMTLNTSVCGVEGAAKLLRSGLEQRLEGSAEK